MSNLVNRLRDWEHVHPEDYNKPAGHLYIEAADRIEELEAQRKKTYEALLSVTRLHDEVEAKLVRYNEVVGDKINLRAENAELKAVLKKLEYWFDADQEVLDAMTPDERADHMRQLQMIRDTLTS